MLKIVVFDSGYGGELFADQLEEELPIVEVIRVIDWRHANEIQTNPRDARKFAQAALRQYVGRVDLIILANHLLSATSLRYFQRKYPHQKFLGIKLGISTPPIKRDALILTTTSVTKTFRYFSLRFRLKCKFKTLAVDDWTAKIDDGELSDAEVCQTLKGFTRKARIAPKEVILACAHFSDLKPALRDTFGANLKVRDGFNDTIKGVCKVLQIRGGTGKKVKKIALKYVKINLWVLSYLSFMHDLAPSG